MAITVVIVIMIPLFAGYMMHAYMTMHTQSQHLRASLLSITPICHHLSNCSCFNGASIGISQYVFPSDVKSPFICFFVNCIFSLMKSNLQFLKFIICLVFELVRILFISTYVFFNRYMIWKYIPTICILSFHILVVYLLL